MRVANWNEELNWAVNKLKGKALIFSCPEMPIYTRFRRKRNNRLFNQTQVSILHVIGCIKEVTGLRLAGLRNIAMDPINLSFM